MRVLLQAVLSAALLLGLSPNVAVAVEEYEAPPVVFIDQPGKANDSYTIPDTDGRVIYHVNGDPEAPGRYGPEYTIGYVRVDAYSADPANIKLVGRTIWDHLYGVHVVRMFGPNRYETAATLASNFPGGFDTVYVARGDEFPDALAAASRPDGQPIPILLTKPDQLPNATINVLKAYKPDEIIVLGSEAAISEKVANQLESYGEVTRTGGVNRYETAAMLAAEFGSPDRAYMATGLDYPDALAGSARAASQGAPMLLTKPGQLPGMVAQVLDQLDPAKLTVLGGKGQVSDEVYQAAGATGRIAGDDRYQTAIDISQTFDRSQVAFLATGLDYPDALAAAALAGVYDAPVLLTRPDRIPNGVLDELERLGVTTVITVGGSTAIGPGALAQLEAWAERN